MKTNETLQPPQENIRHGLRSVELPELGEKIQGKVRDMWRVENTEYKIIIGKSLETFDKIQLFF